MNCDLHCHHAQGVCKRCKKTIQINQPTEDVAIRRLLYWILEGDKQTHIEIMLALSLQVFAFRVCQPKIQLCVGLAIYHEWIIAGSVGDVEEQRIHHRNVSQLQQCYQYTIYVQPFQA